MTTNGIYHTLVTQLDKLARHNRQGSFRTKDRYYEAVKRFCAYLAVHYHLQKLENISGKHLVSYVLYLQEQGKSASTIKTDLSAIRFFRDKMSHPRYALPGNEELGVALERRRFGQPHMDELGVRQADRPRHGGGAGGLYPRSVSGPLRRSAHP